MLVAQPPGPEDASHAGLFAPRRPDDRSSHAQRQAIGYLGLLLPVLLGLFAWWRSVGDFPGWRPLDSVSEYYHSGAVAILTGVLAALAVFLLTYRGYENDGQRLDRRTGKVAGCAALGVSLFPTAAIPPLTAPLWWAEWMKPVHYGSAVALFGSFIFYSLVLFRRSDPAKGGPTEDKKRRNLVYLSCGVGMVLCVAWAGLAGLADRPIFWPEVLALWLFGFSWLTKGRAEWTLREVGKRLRGKAAVSPAPGFRP
ncbi:MAG TPA: hypothetical protein VLT82_13200 [Myxococcaceae bacterium]|nr:hypothetical protein [Myxococcaceae bacterium]